MKKLILFASFFVCTIYHGYSQDKAEPILSGEFGFNATALVSNLLPFDSDFSLSNLDNLLFFKYGNGKTYFRSALNIRHQSTEEDNNDFSSSFGLLKLGFEQKRHLGKSWVFHLGAEVFGSSQLSTTVSSDQFFEDFRSEQKDNRIGVAGIYGIQWRLNNRLAIGTEGYLSISYSEAKNSNFFEGEPSSNNATRKTTAATINLPTSLLLSVYF